MKRKDFCCKSGKIHVREGEESGAVGLLSLKNLFSTDYFKIITYLTHYLIQKFQLIL